MEARLGRISWRGRLPAGLFWIAVERLLPGVFAASADELKTAGEFKVAVGPGGEPGRQQREYRWVAHGLGTATRSEASLTVDVDSGLIVHHDIPEVAALYALAWILSREVPQLRQLPDQPVRAVVTPYLETPIIGRSAVELPGGIVFV